MIPFLLQLFFLLITTYYLFFYFSFLSFAIFFIIIVFFSFFGQKKLFFWTIIIIPIYYFFLSWHTDQFINKSEHIIQGKKFFGIITKINHNKNLYLYNITIDFYFLNGNKIHDKATLYIASKTFIPEGTYVKIPFVHFWNTSLSKEKITSTPLQSNHNAVGSAKHIKIINNYYYNYIYAPIQYIIGIKERIHKQININLEEREKLFFETIFLGKTMPQNSYRELFNFFGITHYLARSGLHIQICLNCLLLIFLFLGITYPLILFLQIIILLFFYFISYASISFWRSLLMFVIYGLCELSKKNISGLEVISLAGIITMILHPFAFLQLSTQLTFLTTLILLLNNYFKYKKTLQ
jgi:hypothetical protein